MTGANPTVRQRELSTTQTAPHRSGPDRRRDRRQAALFSNQDQPDGDGGAAPSLRDVHDLSELYEVDASAAENLMALARQARELGWWKQYDDLRLDPYIGLEQDASAITCFMMFYLPALIQTEDYARAVIKAIAPRIDPKILEQRVEVRMRRQELLEREEPPRYRILLDETALHRPAGGPRVMAAQLDKLVKISARRQGYHPGYPF